MEYIKVIDGLTFLLNKKGRSKKGTDNQKEFIRYIKILKQDFNKEVSTQFLYNLMKENNTLNNRQKRQKIRNLIRNMNTEKQGQYIRGLEVMNYHTDIKEYGLNKWGEVCLKDIRTAHISKEFINSKRKNFNFISVE